MSGPQPRVILAGHSHATALGATFTAKRTWPRLVPLDGRRAGVMGLHGNPRVPLYWRRLVTVARGSTVVLPWAGNQHLVHFLVATAGPFDLRLANHPDEPNLSGAALVPESVVREILARPIAPLAPLLRELRAQRACEPVVMGTPPPKGDDARLRALLRAEKRFFPAVDSDGIDANDVPILPPLVRRKLWLVVQDLLQEVAVETGCLFVPTPAAAMDADGFLAPAYWREDVSHANRAYGELVWAELEQRRVGV